MSVSGFISSVAYYSSLMIPLDWSPPDAFQFGLPVHVDAVKVHGSLPLTSTLHSSSMI